MVYLDGNSLGPPPCAATGALSDMVGRQWGERLIRSWNEGWIEAPHRIGDKIATLIGAQSGEVIVCDSTSVNLFKLIVAALRLDPARRIIVSEAGNFPTDLHVAEGAVTCVLGAELHVLPRAAVLGGLNAETALLLLTQVHYKTAERFDMAAVTATARALGVPVLWDLSHSVGAVEIDLGAAGADLAVGCGYKYLNGGPGAPAFLFVSRRLQNRLATPISGWMGHAAPFAFDDAYRAAPGIGRWLAGTPSMLAMAGLEAGVDLMLEVEPAARTSKSVGLFDAFASIGDALGIECVSPRDAAQRGSHISFRHPNAYALCQALIAAGVIGDFRDPDILRFGLTPLYLRFEDIVRAGEILGRLLHDRSYLSPEFAERRAVT
ncbi:MAG: aminotransferase class V-fold PLP-dependent enzyme [Sphingomonas sp.]|nr:aminotransferase class V-fold PLP-dependent enzyme [Sphingomonas sp.]